MIEFFTSFSMANGAALIGLVSLLVPLAIHLFNRNRGRLILIGHIDLVKPAQKSRTYELRINQWLLLLLRLLILIVSCLVVAGIYSQQPFKRNSLEQVYVTPQWLSQASQPEILALQQQHKNAQVFLLKPTFPLVTLDSLPSLAQDIKASSAENWLTNFTNESLLAELALRTGSLPQTVVYTTNQLNQYAAVRPSALPKVQWRIKSSLSEALVSTPVNILVVYTADRQLDQAYLSLAFEWIAEQSPGVLNVEYGLLEANQNSVIQSQKLVESTQPDWVFWLNQQAVDEPMINWLKQGHILLRDSENQTVNGAASTTIKKISMVDQQPLEFYFKTELNDPGDPPKSKRIATQPAAPKIVTDHLWVDQVGDPVLSRTRIGDGTIFNFNSRFHHQWTNLVEQSLFPQILTKLLLSHQLQTANEVVAISEIESLSTEPSTLPASQQISRTNSEQPLLPWLILLLCLLWLIERYFSEVDNSSKIANGSEVGNSPHE